MIQINHTEYPKSLKSKSDNALRFIMKDAADAERANPESEKAGYYLDEMWYCAMELAHRLKDTKRFGLRGALNQAREVCEPINVSRVAS